MLAPVEIPPLPPDFHLKLRTRFLARFRDRVKPKAGAVCYFAGGRLAHKNDEDVDYPFHQESSFFYLFGVEEEDCEGVLEVDSGQVTLIVTQPGESALIYTRQLDKVKFQQKYSPAQVVYQGEREALFQRLNPSQIHVYEGRNSDSGLMSLPPAHPLLAKYQVVRDRLFHELNECRVIKTQDQLQVLRYVCKATSESLILAMQNARPGLRQTQLSALFQFDFSRKTCSLLDGFNPISACCESISVLHYLNGERVLGKGDFVLNDMGGRWNGYVADQAITYPVGGVFSQKQRKVYSAVLQAQQTVKKHLREGVDWTQMHLLAERVILRHLQGMGILKGDLGLMQQKRVGAIFFPHGLGHFFGLLVHDVGGYGEGPARHASPGLKNLRTRRTLQAGMTITVEPGLYFIRFLVEKARLDPQQAVFINFQVLQEYMSVGGVRLEDDVLITKEGHQMLSHLPRSIEAVEACCRGETWK